MTDLDYIRETIKLARRGAALVSPNPLVGSIIVKNDKIVGSGFHRFDELKHAEVWALEQAGDEARGATVYVNLEPCSHYGDGKRTPPCVDALINAGVKRVVSCIADPNPQVNGSGFDRLKSAGIDVTIGLMEREAKRLNEKYIKYVNTGMPFVHLKTACSLDGRIATKSGDSQWITGEEARVASQELRHEYDAILVGIGTVLADDPLLTDRTQLPRRGQLVRVVMDSELRIPLHSKLVTTAREYPLIIFCSIDSEYNERRMDLEELGVEVVPIEKDLKEMLKILGEKKNTSIIIEGGAKIAGSFIDNRLVDKVTFFIAPKIIGGRDAKSSVGGAGVERLADALELNDIEIKRHGRDVEITGYTTNR